MNFDKLIRTRHSVRKFKDRMPDWRDIIEAIDAARFAPMAGNNHTVNFILVNDSEIIQQLSQWTQQQFIAEAYHVVVVVSNPRRTINAFGMDKGGVYLRLQAGAAIQNFMLKLTEKGLSTCWVAHYSEENIKHLLNVPENFQVDGVFPIGYEFKKIKIKKPKINLDNILFFNRYGNRQMKNIKTVDS